MHSKRNIHLMYAIALLHGMVFYAPIASLYRQQAGLNLKQIALIEAFSYIISLAMELPWGMLADRIGHRRTMIAGCSFFFLSKIIFWRAESFAAFLLERFVLSIAVSALSGVEESILFLSCGKADSQRTFALHNACSTAGVMLAASAQALLFAGHYRLTALATMVSYGLAMLLSLGIESVQAPLTTERTTGKGFLQLLKQMASDRRFLAFLAGFALLHEAVQMATVWLNQNQYLRCGMDQSAMGLAYILVNLVAMLGAFSSRVRRRLGYRRFTWGFCIAAALGCAALTGVRSGVLSVLCIAMVAASGAMLMPMASEILSRRAQGMHMATSMSCFALLQSLCSALANTMCGSLADFSLNAALFASAAMCLACGAACALLGKQA